MKYIYNSVFTYQYLSFLKYGDTPMHIATCNGHEDIVQMLVNAGGNIHSTDNVSMFVLHIEIYYSGALLFWTPLAPSKLSWLKGCPHFRGEAKFRIIWSVLNAELSSFLWAWNSEVPLYNYSGGKKLQRERKYIKLSEHAHFKWKCSYFVIMSFCM